MDALLSVLETPDVDVRKFIVDILGDIGDTRAVPALIGKLDDPDENIRVAAAESPARYATAGRRSPSSPA